MVTSRQCKKALKFTFLKSILMHYFHRVPKNGYNMSSYQDSDLQVRRTTLGSIADIAKHTPELSEAVIEAGIVSMVAPWVSEPDKKIKQEVALYSP